MWAVEFTRVFRCRMYSEKAIIRLFKKLHLGFEVDLRLGTFKGYDDSNI